jgi:hypothetical protein
MLSKTNKTAAAMLLAAIAATTVVLGQAGPQLGAPPSKSSKPTPYILSGIYTLAGKADKPTAKTFNSDTKDVSAIYVKGGGDLTLTDAVIATTVDTSSEDNSTQFGLNAAVLAGHAGKIKMTGGSITTAGSGANAVYAAGSTISLSKTTISVAGEASHGVIASAGGNITIADIDIATSGANAAAIAIDKGGGSITVTGGTITTGGDKSPAIYSTGIVKVTGATLTATGAEAATIDGKGSITLVDTKLTGQKNHGVLIYQPTTGVAGVTGTFNMKGGSLTATDGPLFFVTNTTASIFVTGVSLNSSEGTLVKAASDAWGTAGSNGGIVTFTADHETLTGDFLSEAPSSITAKLQNQTTLNGKVKGAAISLDSTSIWTVTDDSTITVLTDSQGAPGGALTNIVGNGHDVHYDASLTGNAWLKGRTYELSSGGKLRPIAGTNHNTNSNNPNNNNNNGRGYGGAGGGGGGGGGGRRG